MLYGIQAAKDVKLSNVGRCLNGSTALIKTENRLCRQLASEDLTERVNRQLCWDGAGRVTETTVLAVDLSDVRKEYAKKMEHLAHVRDGSTGEIVKGYWLRELLAADVVGDSVTPLYAELYSHEADDFKSENAQILKAVNCVSQATDRRGIFAIDRGGDPRNILIPLLERGLRFVVRQKGDRHVVMPCGLDRGHLLDAVEVRGSLSLHQADPSTARHARPKLRGPTEPLRLGARDVLFRERRDRSQGQAQPDSQEGLRKSEALLGGRDLFPLRRRRWHPPATLRRMPRADPPHPNPGHGATPLRLHKAASVTGCGETALMSSHAPLDIHPAFWHTAWSRLNSKLRPGKALVSLHEQYSRYSRPRRQAAA